MNFKFKLLLMATLSISNLDAATFAEFDSKYKSSNINKSFSLYSSIGENLGLSPLEIKVLENKFGNDVEFKKGLYSLHNSMTIKNDPNNGKMPDYYESFKHLQISANKGNILASYIGLKLLQQNFLYPNNSIGKKYLRSFAMPLANEKYTIGQFWTARSYMKKWSTSADYQLSRKYSKLVFEKLSKKKELSFNENYLNDSAKKDYALAGSMQYSKDKSKKEFTQKELQAQIQDILKKREVKNGNK